MKILWLTVDRSHRVAQQFDIFRNAVKKVADVTVIQKDITGSDGGAAIWQLSRDLVNNEVHYDNVVLNHLEHHSDYDFIYCDSFFAFMQEEWGKFEIPSAIFIEDVHEHVPKMQMKHARRIEIENIFHRFNFPFHKIHKAARRDFRCFWLPHSVNIERFHPYGDKEIGVLHVGVFPRKYYPWRAKAIFELKDKSYFTRINRPKEGGDRSRKWPIDDDYAELISSAKICITDGSIFGAPVQKYVEIPACNTLLMSNWFPDLGLMGFRDGHSMVAYEKENVVEKVESILDDNKELKRISNNGMELILSKHTSEVRARQFINNICQIVGHDLEFPEVDPCSFQVNFINTTREFKAIYPQTTERTSPENPKVVRLTKRKTITGTDWRSRIEAAKH
jgi:hypothetical protein